MIGEELAARVAASRVDGGERRHLSIPRLVIVLIAIAAAAFFAVRAATGSSGTSAPLSAPWFGPYVDVTLTPQYPFEQATADPARAVVLGFVVADPSNGCAPSWGGQVSPAGASTRLDLDRRITRLRAGGSDVVVSFGGAANQELALTCADPTALTAAYQSIIDRYKVGTIDLDLEGAALRDAASLQRRAVAVRALEDHATAAGSHLAVWLTLPVTPAGLSPDASSALNQMLSSHVSIAGVNALTQNFGGSRDVRDNMGTASVKALTATHAELDAAYRANGIKLTSAQVWNRIGATPIIGRNDVPGETFTLDDGRTLVAFRAAHDLGRLSLWSLNRDTACGPNVGGSDATLHCSGVQQRPLEFSRLFATLKGRPKDPAPKGGAAVPPVPAVDNPATSPYPIWTVDAAYPKGSKVVWHGNVYQAKWWSQDDYPDAPVAHDYDTPWQLVGPVLPGEHPTSSVTVPAGTYPAWLFYQPYQKGARVLYKGVGYEARYFTQGDAPDASLSSPGDSPWAPITSG